MISSVIWTIAAREFLANLKTLRFTVCFVLAIVLGALVSYIATEDYEREMEEYSRATALSQDETRDVRVWMDLKPTVHKHPEPLSLFARGISRRVAGSATVGLDQVPELSGVGQTENPFLSIFPSLDVLIVVKVVLGLLSILLSFDAVAGERERGTLSMTLSNPVSRAVLLVGKWLGAMSSLVVATAVGFLVTLLVFIRSPMVSLSLGEWGRIGLIFV